MTTLTAPSPHFVVDTLRGERQRRPLVDNTGAAGLRSLLEDGLFEITRGTKPETPLVLRSSSLRQLAPSTDIALSPLGRVRGILVNQVLRLLSVGTSITSPFEDALRAWLLEEGPSGLTRYVDQLRGDERARLEADVTSHSHTLIRSLGPVPSRWLPRSAVRATQHLGGGSVILRDVIDLMVGTTNSALANVALLDVTTSPLGEGGERVMRYHALVQTLRTSLVPLRTSVFSTATGDLWSLDVDTALLVRSVHEVLSTVESLWSKP
jgi:hypothetical protein